MRVTMLVRCLAMMRGGGEIRHLAWARELTARGVEVEIVAGRPLFRPLRHPVADAGTLMVRSPYMRDLVYRVQGRRGLGRLASWALHADEEWFCRAVWKRIAASPRPPDLVHAHALHQAARLRRGNVPVVITLPGPPPSRYHADLGLADALISDGWGAAHLPALLGLQVEEVPKGVDTDLFTPEGANLRARLGLEGRRVVLCVSRLVPIKNVSVLLDAFAEALAVDPLLSLLIVGEGPQRAALEARARALGLDAAVRLVGYVAHETLPAWYRTADLFVLPSTFDNSPNVVLEAMASGLPIVATDVGGVSRYIRPGRNGQLVPNGSPQALASALLGFLREPELARAVGARNRADAVTGFSWRASATALLDVYARVIARRQARATAAAKSG